MERPGAKIGPANNEFGMTEFTPFQSLAGGLMIGMAAFLLMALHGRIAGMTGILSGALLPTIGDWAWRALFLVGAIAAPLIFMLAGGTFSFAVPLPPGALILGGLIVGIGVTLGGGCTSGHGVCGIARFSRRSFAATATFMAAAFVTVYLIRHVFS